MCALGRERVKYIVLILCIYLLSMEKSLELKMNLTEMPAIIQGLAGEHMDGGDLTEHPPAWAVGSKEEVMIVIHQVLCSGVGRPAQEVGVMNLQELLGD